MRIHLVICLFFIPFFSSLSLDINLHGETGYCLSQQRSLLLNLRKNLAFNFTKSTKLVHWNQTTDCCQWQGVTCSEGHVIALDLSQESIYGGFDDSSSLFSLEYLQSLNLGYNDFNTTIPSAFHKLSNLRYLNLENAGFVGQIPFEISQLISLFSLKLSTDHAGVLKLEDPSLHMLIQTLKNITHLYLDGIKISPSGNELFNALSSSLPNLQVLSLMSCNLSGPIDSSLARLQSLRKIRLRSNNLSSPIPEFFAKFKNLTFLDISDCDLQGNFPEGIFQIESLKYLNASSNDLHGSLPDFSEAAPLQTLVLRETNFSGSLPNSIGNLRQLIRLDLYDCCFSGTVPNSLWTLTHLQFLDLSANFFIGPIPSFNMAKNLTWLYLNNNDFNGTIPSTHFQGLLNLVDLQLIYNSFSGSIPSSIFMLPSLQRIRFRNNQFDGQLDNFVNVSSSVIVLDLRNNNLEGLIPPNIGNHFPQILFLSFSGNKFHGSIPESLCNATSLLLLDLSSNFLTGRIPKCLIAMNGALAVLNLTGNKLSGSVDTLPGSCNLKVLALNDNFLEGKIPKYLTNCSMLEVLDVGNNRMDDTFPCWLKSLSTLHVLILRFNQFHGSINCQRTDKAWLNLQIFDLASNSFSGGIPSAIFTSSEEMMADKTDEKHLEVEVNKTGIYYQDTITLTSKGMEAVLVKILTAFTFIDLSCNKFQGSIPEELGQLKALRLLNLSHNAFSSHIPSFFGNLKNLESLDLSNNSLSGEIPIDLASLSFLSVLNLSFNHLEGSIPTGTQLQTFPETSFEGNEGLCGPPLIQNCSKVGIQLNSASHMDKSIDWNFISIELGFTFGIGIVFLPLLLWKPWRLWYWGHAENMLCCIFPQLDFVYQNHGGKWYRTLRWKAY